MMNIVILKSVLCEIPSLTLLVSSNNFLLQTDASGVGLGAVLSVIREGEELPVAFWSRKLQPRERNYGATELEGLAVVATVQHFDAYLITHPFRIQNRPSGSHISEHGQAWKWMPCSVGHGSSALHFLYHLQAW